MKKVNLSEIYKPIKDDLEKVEESLAAEADVDSPLLAEILTYTLKNGGKRIRPSLTLLAGKFYVYNPSLLVPMATAVELLHTATLVHDDIVDNSPVRRGKPTVSRAWGGHRALLLGDYLFARAGSLTATTGNLKVIKLFSQTLMTISCGELKQTGIVFDLKQARQLYFDWISAKTACLFSTATESGAILSQAPEHAIQALRNYGHNFGIAFQIIDDVLDFIGDAVELGKPVGSDLAEGIVTLPTILYAEANPADNVIKKAIENRDANSVALALDNIRNSTAIEQCLALASDFCARASQALRVLPDNCYRQSLLDLANYIVQRRK